MPKTIFRRDVTESSTTESDLGNVGELREETDGRVYRLVQAGASVADGGIVQLDSVSASTGVIVEPPHAELTPIYGANQMGQSVAANGYFFVLVKGTCSVRSADIGSDLSMAAGTPPVGLNSDNRLESISSVVATNSEQVQIYGQFIESVSRASDATTTGRFYIHGLGA